MRGILVAGFWCWFACSCVILTRRAIRRRTAPKPPRPAATAEQPIVAQPLLAVAPSVAPVVPIGQEALVASHVTATTPPIAEALRGIALPCDLGPLVAGGTVDFQRRAVFYSRGYPAEIVGAAVADALEDIGMSFTTLHDDVAVARRGDTAVRVTVHPIGAAVKGVADPAYPTAPPNSVVVDFELA